MITNFFPIQFPFSEYDVQRLPYSDERLQQLRAQHNAEASFFRAGEDLLISPRKGSALSLGEVVRIAVAAQVRTTEQMVRHLLFRTFRDALPDRVPEDFSPLRFPSVKAEFDPLSRLLPASLAGKVLFPRVTEVYVRSVLQNDQPVIGLLILSRHRWRFTTPVSELVAEGFPVNGCSVTELVPLPGLAGVLAPEENVLGEIEGLEGDQAVIRTNTGVARRPLTRLLLQRTREQLGRYLEFKLGAAGANKVFEGLGKYERDRVREGGHFNEVVRAARWFAGQTYKNADGFTFTVSESPEMTEAGMRLERTRLVFDYSPGAADAKPFGGLSKYGPFDSGKFDRKRPRLLAVFHHANHGAATQFLAQLIEGIPTSSYFKKGLRDLFRLHAVDYALKELPANFAEDYERAIDEAVREAGANKFDLALVECPDDTSGIPAESNPYYRAKARLMSYGIPVQCVRQEHLRGSSHELGFTLGPTALQVYAKLGGVPWLLPGSQSVDAELIVGIGNTIHRPNLWSGAEQSRIVGLTTFFLGDGRYLLGQELRAVPYGEYFQELLRSLEESIRYVAGEYQWKEGKTVRLVFHVFKPLKHLEVEVIDALVKKFPQFRIIYAFVTIAKFHPWMMFQEANFFGSRCQLSICERGANLVLDQLSCLVQLRGEKDRPNKTHRPPYPVLIRIHEKSTYKDLPYITQQIMDFSFLNWRSFYPTETPVTMFYASLMAELSAKLQRVKGWNSVFLDQHFRRKAWFL